MISHVLPLIAGLLSVALAGIVAAEGTNSRSMKWPYVVFAGSVGIWAIFVALFLLVPSAEWGRIFVFIYYSTALLIPCAFLFFSLAYLSIPISRFVTMFALLPWSAMTILIAIPGMMIGAISQEPPKSVELVTPVYVIYTALFIAYLAIGLGFLVAKALRARGRHAHRRIVAVALALGFAGGGYFNLILPFFGNYSLIAYGPSFAFVASAAIFYVIARHQLFDIRFTVIRTVNYLLTLLMLSGLYLLVAFLIFNVLLGRSDEPTQVAFNLFLTLILALVFQPVKLFFDRWTNRFFYRYSYNSDEVFAGLTRILNSTTDLHRLLTKSSQHLATALRAAQAFFIVYVGESGFVRAGTPQHSKLPIADARWLNDYVRNSESAILVDSEDEKDQMLHRFMVSHRLGVIVPLLQDEAVVGYLCLGEHQKSGYTQRDLRLLTTISDELIIAIQNALSVQEVRDLNASLEQRIDSATKELRASNAQLQRLDEAKDEFISMASHQLRTPLTSIKGYISMMLEGDVGAVNPRQKKILEEAFTSSERMVRLIGDFLNVSRLQTGKFVIEKKPVNLAELVERELQALEPNARARGLKFIYKHPKAFPILELDESKLQQVVMNFADNALYYSKENTKIMVDLKVVKGRAEFTVKDAGIGVPVSEQAHLFNKFFRATNARKQRPDGTGVGLFLAKKVIDAHDGRVIFESTEGKGSTFGFSLPIRTN